MNLSSPIFWRLSIGSNFIVLYFGVATRGRKLFPIIVHLFLYLPFFQFSICCANNKVKLDDKNMA